MVVIKECNVLEWNVQSVFLYTYCKLPTIFQIFSQKNNDSLYYDQSFTHVLGEEGTLIAQTIIINRSQSPENPFFLFNNKHQILVGT